MAGLDVNASGQSTGIFCHQKRAAAHVRTDSQIIDAITGKDQLLHYKCRIDQPPERFHIPTNRFAESNIPYGRRRVCTSSHDYDREPILPHSATSWNCD